MTGKQLLEFLSQLPEEHLESNVWLAMNRQDRGSTIYQKGERAELKKPLVLSHEVGSCILICGIKART